MIKNLAFIFAMMRILLAYGSNVSAGDSIDKSRISMAIGCVATTPAQDKVFFSTDQGYKVCVDHKNMINDLSVVSMQISYVRISDGYALLITVDGIYKDIVANFSSKNMHKEMELLTNGVVLARASIEGPSNNGVIIIFTPDRQSAEAIGEKISGHKGKLVPRN